MTALRVRAAGNTHQGAVRTNNEDALIVEPQLGLFVVFDGMGGAASGDVASARARDVILEYVRSRRASMPARALLEAAINAASAAVHHDAQHRRDRKGMGTTVVAALIDGKRATIAHVGDSRAYLLREGRLHALTSDHTIVAELVMRGVLKPQDADRHAYKNVLSRNLGSKPSAVADVNELDLQAGDRLLLCSDGLHGYASMDAVHHLVAAPEPPADVVRALIAAALRGGGGDNITAVVVEAGAAAMPRATMVLRTTGAMSWWTRRDRFLAACRASRIHRSLVCAHLPSEQALAAVAGGFADAVFHDLEKLTGVHTWTYAEGLARDWLGRGGTWAPLREVIDGLARAADQVLRELRTDDEALAGLVETALARVMVTVETAVAAVLAQQLRSIENELVRVDAEQTLRSAGGAVAAAAAYDSNTVPFRRIPAPVAEVAAPEVIAALEVARSAARAQASAASHPVLRTLEWAHRVASPAAGECVEDAVRELWAVPSLDEIGVKPLFDAIEYARRIHLDAVRRTGAGATRLAATRRIAAAYQQLSSGVAAMAIGAAAPASERLRAVARETARLRREVSHNEALIAEREQQLPLGSARGGAAARSPRSRNPGEGGQ